MKKISILMLTIALALPLAFNTEMYAGKNKPDKSLKDKPYNYKNDEFFNKTQPIMLKNEVQIYKHLPDEVSRQAFAEDFWKKRDPSPGTEENENRMEYERRIEYVNRFFRERVGTGRGWESDRGKVYVLLGEPDERSTQLGYIIDRFGHQKRVLKEIWVYNYHRLYLEFVDRDELGRYRLRNWSASLLSAFDRAKFQVIPIEKADQAFKFKADVDKNEVNIHIPINTVTFDESENIMNARFKITLFIYHKYKKVNQNEETRDFRGTKEELLNRKNIELTIPITVSLKGKYLFDVIVEEVSSGAKYRDMIKHKI